MAVKRLSSPLTLLAVVGLLLTLAFCHYVLGLEQNSLIPTRFPSSLQEAHQAELSIYPYNEAFSIPDRGSSLFDKIFSESRPSGQREYNIPYPFQKFVAQLTKASGGVRPLQTLFPMGRSLQRVAAIAGMKNVTNADPFYRYPRLVLGFDQESVNSEDHLNLNVKGRFYVGMNEKAQLLEVISYNDEAGRFEYQVVRDYNANQKPTVVYANRQLCLTCHQNQTPIFSQGPWKESNANPAMSDGMLRVMRSQMGDHPCVAGADSPFCFDGKDQRYFGAPLVVDISVPQALDQATKLGNNFHAYHKMWQRLCPDLECRKQLLRQIFLYKLVGQNILLLTPDLQNLNQILLSRWQKEFPLGMSLPDASVPNRDPLLNVKDQGREDLSLIRGKAPAVRSALEDVLSLGNIPGEFEPARTRAPMQPPWTSPFLLPETSVGDSSSQVGVARLIAGYADFFTASDAKSIDQILVSQTSNDIENLKSDCSLLPGSGGGSLTLKCQISPHGQVSFSTFLRPTVSGQDDEWSGAVNQLRVQSASPVCDPKTIASISNLSKGLACFQANNLRAIASKKGAQLNLRFVSASGLSVRLLDGRRLGSVQFSLPTAAVSLTNLSFPVLNDLAPLRFALEKSFAAVDAAFDKTTGLKRYVDGPALNRNHVMAMLMQFLGKPQDQLFTLTKDMQSLKKVSEAPDDEITQVENLKPVDRALAVAMHNCGACHYNRDNVPPAYLGGPTESLTVKDRCQRLATCSPRMLYRLKMWDCSPGDYASKKSPMPPLARFTTLNISLDFWKQHDRKQLFQALQAIFPKAELPAYLMQQGLSRDESLAITNELQTLGCEPRDSEIFEKLPRCDKDLPLNVAPCLQ